MLDQPRQVMKVLLQARAPACDGAAEKKAQASTAECVVADNHVVWIWR